MHLGCLILSGGLFLCCKRGERMELYEDERIDFLTMDKSLQIIQSDQVFSYAIDAVLLANFASVPIKRGKILDLCTGNGVIPLLLSKKSIVRIDAVEIQERLYSMAKRSVTLNDKEDQINLIHADLKDMPKRYGNDKFDLVTVNPPYFNTKAPNHHNKNSHLTIARHEVLTTLEAVIETASRLTKSGGKMAMVHRPGRLVDILTLMRRYKLEPKRIQWVYPSMDKEANILLIEAVRDGKADLKTLAPFYVFDDSGQYTNEMERLIND